MQSVGGADVVRGWFGLLIVCHFIHLSFLQSSDPGFDVPLGNQHDDRLIVSAGRHIRGLECLRKLCGAMLRGLQIGINHDHQKSFCSPAERGPARLSLARVTVADVFLSAATPSAGSSLKPTVSNIVSASLKVSADKVLLLDILGEDDLVGNPFRHFPILER